MDESRYLQIDYSTDSTIEQLSSDSVHVYHRFLGKIESCQEKKSKLFPFHGRSLILQNTFHTYFTSLKLLYMKRRAHAQNKISEIRSSAPVAQW